MCSNIPETDCQNAVTFFITVPVLWGTKPHQLCEGTVEVLLRYQSQTSPYKIVLAQKLAQVGSSSAARPVAMKFRTWIDDDFRVILVPKLY